MNYQAQAQSLSNIPETVLLQRLAAGDEQVFTHLYNEYQPLITKLLYPFNPPVEPPEIVQDIFYKIWLKRELMPGVRSFKSYLLKMVRNRLIDKNKTFRLHRQHQESYAVLKRSEVEPGTDTILYNELHEKTRKAIAELPVRQRQVLELTLLYDLNREEIARQLDISVWVVDKDLGQATKTVRHFIENYGLPGNK